MQNSSWRRYQNYIFLIPLFAAALLYQITNSFVAFHRAIHGTAISDFPFDTNDGTVDSVNGDAEKAGLHVGDRILKVDGRDLKNARVLVQEIHLHKPAELLTLTVIPKSQSVTRTVRVPLRAASTNPATTGNLILTGVLTAMALFCVLVGIYVAAILPNDIRAIVFFGLMLALSQVTRNAGWYDFPAPLWVFAEAWGLAAGLSWILWLVCFALYFPERFQWDRRRPWLKWLFLAPIIFWNLLVTVDAVSGQFDFHAFPTALNRALQPSLAYAGLLLAGGIMFFFVSLGVKIRTAKNRDACRRLRTLMAGSIIGLGPLGLLILYRTAAHKGMFDEIPEPVSIAIGLLFCLFPLTLAYTIVTERAMDLRMVIRQGVRYTLARGGMQVLLAIATGLMMWGINVLVFGSMLNSTAKFMIAAVVPLVMVIVVRRTRDQLITWINRRYFREAYNAELLLEDLSETVHSMVDRDVLLDTVARRISESMHVPQVAILLNGEGVFRPVYCLGFEPLPELLLPEDCKTVSLVKETKDPPRIYFDRNDNWVHTAPETELVTLRSIHAQLLLPIGLKNKLLGIFSLGPKRSEEPYSRTDIQLLRSVTLQTGLALENSRLMSAVAEEMAKRERLNREIEIAREVQERLFPQRLPAMAGIDYFGACRPALGVGGDYYDFLKLANGDLGIAIGDVSGKGIAAALLMASLQASLRGQAMMSGGDLAHLMCNVNQLIYDATPPNRYATFFYGQYNQESRIFIYVNAGHNPPFILRRTQDGAIHVIRLETGGPVVGLFPHAPYQQGSLGLEPGDLFVGFTDGISEAMNKEDEEWGEERLIPTVAANAGHSAAEIIPNIIAEADRFVSGAPQHDDMTLVVLKCASRVPLSCQTS